MPLPLSQIAANSSSLLLFAPGCDCAAEARSSRSRGLDPLTRIVDPHQDFLNWIVSPCMGHKVTMRDVCGGQEGCEPDWRLQARFRGLFRGVFRRCAVMLGGA